MGIPLGRTFRLASLVTALVSLTACQELIMAAMNGDRNRVHLLLDQGMNVNVQDPEMAGDTALHVAAKDGRVEIVRLLLERGADVRATNNFGATPLQPAAYFGREEIVRILLEAGSDVNARSRTGWTALHAASRQGQDAVVRLLLSRGADAHAKTNDGYTAADLARLRGHANLVQVLNTDPGVAPAPAALHPSSTPAEPPPPPIY